MQENMQMTPMAKTIYNAMESFNGWSNRETWAAALWIDNDQWLLETALDYAKQEIDGHDEGEEINPYYLGEALKYWLQDDLLTLENIAGNQSLFNMLTDIGSLYRVDWRELGQHYLEQLREAVA